MMKKFKLKGLKLTSPRKERKNDDAPQSPVSIDSQDDSYCTPDVKPEKNGSETHKRRSGILNTLRRKLNTGLRRTDDGRRANTWHIDGPSGSGISGTATLPTAKVSSCRAVPRHTQKPMRPAVSEERLSSADRSPDFLSKSRFYKSEQMCRRRRDPDIFLKHETSHSSRSEDESEKEESQQDEEGKVLLPMDTEYGHASAPSSNEQSGAMVTSSSSDSDTAPPSAGLIPTEDPPSPVHHIARSSQPATEQQDRSLAEHVQSHQVSEEYARNLKQWSLTDELFILSKYGWYWGPITRVEAEDKLANQPDGAFLVRDSSDERYLLSLSFRSYGRTLHTRIEHCNGVFSFYAQPECEGYKSVVSLIQHSMSDSQTGVFCYSRARTPGAPSFPVRLTKPVSRFTHVRSLQYLCRFVIRQNTRYDHIQKLPLPTSIKGWLEENQY